MNIGIVGHFGGKEKFYDGQTVKTVTFYEALLRRQDPNIKVNKIDTYYIKRNPLRFTWQLLRSLFRDQKIVLLVSNKGRRVMFPILYVYARYFGKDVYHYAIAAKLAREAATHKGWIKYLNAFRGNWMEGRDVVEDLHRIGVKNAIYLPNFKSLQILREDELPYSESEPFRFCTFSRVLPGKGIEDAIHAVDEINARAGRRRAELTVYGPIEKSYEDTFARLMEESHASSYGGVIPANDSVDTLKSFYALLFPTTFWKSEGIPGTIIDAFSAGIPVIARRWLLCHELLEDGVNGFIYDQDRPDLLVPTMEKAMDDVAATRAMKVRCLAKAQEYSEEEVMRQIAYEMGIT